MSLFDAIAENDYDLAIKLINDKTVDINETNKNGETPLFIALKKELNEIYMLLINKGANVNTPNKNGKSPLFIALENELNEVCKLLISKGADVNQENKNGKTPLFIALENELDDLAILLLENGADVNKVDNKEKTPIMYAIQRSDDKMCELLISKGANVNQVDMHGETPLFLASQNGLVEICELLINKEADVNQPNKHRRTPLYIATHEGNNLVCELLIRKGADVNQADINEETPLYQATDNNNVFLCNLLINNGAKVNQPNIIGETPLFIASFYGHLTICELLISKGADVNQPNKDGETPLIIALRDENTEIINLLIKSGATKGPDFDYQNAPSNGVKKNLEDFKKSLSPVEKKSPRTAYNKMRGKKIKMLGTKHGELFKIKINYPNIFELFQNYRNLSKHPDIDCGLQVLFSLGLREINASKHNAFVINKLGEYNKSSGISVDDFIEYLIKIFDLQEDSFVERQYTHETICAYLIDNLLEGHSSIIILDFDKFSHMLVTFKYDGIVYFFDPQLSLYGKNEQHVPPIFRCDDILHHYDSPINYFYTLQLKPGIKDKTLIVDNCNLPLFARGRKTKKANKRKTRKPKKSNKTKQNKK